MFNCTVFSSLNNTYLYDGVSGNILLLDKNSVEEIKSFCNTRNANSSEVKKAIDDGLIIPAKSTELLYWFDEDSYYKTLYEEMSHLMISITDSCNMRCKYCVYGGHYPNERVHGYNHMQPKFLIKIIDRFLELSKNENKIFNFYGGEPFLCFSEIKTAVSYINTHTEKSLVYITTNGTILTDEVCEWFANTPNVHLYISIAGVPAIHDELRLFANGEPTFNVIANNLTRLKKFASSSYNERIHFIFNLLDERQLFDLQYFWDTHEIFDEISDLPEVTFIDCVDDDGTVAELCHDISKECLNLKSPLDEYIRLLSIGDHENIIVKHYDNKFLRIHNRTCNIEPKIFGTCRPFVKKMFVDLSGGLHMCENFTFGDKFGSIFDDFEVDRIKELLNIYKEYRYKECSECWANKLCSLCFRDVFDRNGVANPIRAKKICAMEKLTLEHTLNEYCTVLETNSTILDHLNEYEVFD